MRRLPLSGKETARSGYQPHLTAGDECPSGIWNVPTASNTGQGPAGSLGCPASPGHSVEDLKDEEENEARRGKFHQPGRFLRTVLDKLYFSSGSPLKEGSISPTLFCTCPTLSLEKP